MLAAVRGIAILQLEGVSKRYGSGPPVVDGLDLALADGEFLTLLGPSGCGKSTVLRLLAGLEAPTAGRILLRERDITGEPAHRRPLNTVFQEYALFPHLSVRANVAFGLAMRKVAGAERARRVAEMLELVGLAAQAEQRPATLSGGQKQRVALARALVCRPEVLLLDEPLSALDAGRRVQMQAELKALQARLATTFLLVTHDQTEALSLSDRIALMRAGRIVQIDTPQAIYDAPADAYAAAFLGPANLLPAVMEGGVAQMSAGEIRLRVQGGAAGAGLLCIRPAWVRLAAAGEDNAVPVRVRSLRFHGEGYRLEGVAEPGGQVLLADLPRGSSLPAEGQLVRLALPAERLLVLPP